MTDRSRKNRSPNEATEENSRREEQEGNYPVGEKNHEESFWNRWKYVFLRVGLLFSGIGLVSFAVGSCFFSMPGSPQAPPLPPISETESRIQKRARKDVERLAKNIGDRNVYRYKQLTRARDYIQNQFREAGYSTRKQTFTADGKEVANVVAEKPGTEHPDHLLVIGAHYDTAANPGADDNASGVAGVLNLARELAGTKTRKTIHFVAFVNEEPPYYKTEQMGSRVYARRASEKNKTLEGMMSLEMIGFYSEKEDSQDYPLFLFDWLYPDTGNFIAFLSNYGSRNLLYQYIGTFRETATIPSWGAVIPGGKPAADLSDNWSFWQEGYPAIMVTDTAMFRNPNYHRSTDTPDTLDYNRMARVVVGLKHVVLELAGTKNE